MAGLFRWLRELVFRRANSETKVRTKNESADIRELAEDMPGPEGSSEFDPTIPNLRVINTELPDIEDSIGFDPYDNSTPPVKPKNPKR